MAVTARRISISRESALGRALEDARQRGDALELEVEGHTFRFTPAPDSIWANYDAERTRQALRESAGALRGVDRDALLRDLRDARGQSSSGRPA